MLKKTIRARHLQAMLCSLNGDPLYFLKPYEGKVVFERGLKPRRTLSGQFWWTQNTRSSLMTSTRKSTCFRDIFPAVHLKLSKLLGRITWLYTTEPPFQFEIQQKARNCRGFRCKQVLEQHVSFSIIFSGTRNTVPVLFLGLDHFL